MPDPMQIPTEEGLAVFSRKLHGTTPKTVARLLLDFDGTSPEEPVEFAAEVASGQVVACETTAGAMSAILRHEMDRRLRKSADGIGRGT